MKDCNCLECAWLAGPAPIAESDGHDAGDEDVIR